MAEPRKHPLKCYNVDNTGDVLATLYFVDRQDVEISILRLSSKVLSLVSPTFREMLDPTKESKESQVNREGMKEIRIATSSEASAILALNILHYQTENLPKPGEIPISDLYHLANFANLYQCQRFLKLWVPAWANPAWKTRSPHKDTAKWLWISITFQLPNIVQDCAQEVFERMKIQQGVFKADGEDLNGRMRTYADIIWKRREKWLLRFTDEVNEKYRAFEKQTQLRASPSKCDMVQLGIFQVLRLKINLPKSQQDAMNWKELFSMFKLSVEGGLPIKACRNRVEHILCGSGKDLSELAAQYESVILKKSLVSALGIPDDA
ncbi:hypothetical protein TWF281_001437 [Arthrobotrys megalospora]